MSDGYGDAWMLDGGVALTNVHQPFLCAGRPCVLHNPSDHHMRDWPLTAHARGGVVLMERRCDHGIGHPDPDAAGFILSRGRDEVLVHGCDGCCAPRDAPGA